MSEFEKKHSKNLAMPTAQTALPGTSEQVAVFETHFVNGHRMLEPFPALMKKAMFGMGCFWGAERKLWQQGGIYSTAVGYAAGFTPNPSYEEVCTGQTGHNEVVRVIFDPSVISYQQLLAVFWENHNPTQGLRQGNDIGTQYRSGIYCFDDTQLHEAIASKDRYQQALQQADYPAITTEILTAPPFYYAEPYHQQYLAKNPAGYCGLGGTGVGCI